MTVLSLVLPSIQPAVKPQLQLYGMVAWFLPLFNPCVNTLYTLGSSLATVPGSWAWERQQMSRNQPGFSPGKKALSP